MRTSSRPYWGQPETCRACGTEGHYASNPVCPRKGQRGVDSYAARAAGRRQGTDTHRSREEEERRLGSEGGPGAVHGAPDAVNDDVDFSALKKLLENAKEKQQTTSGGEVESEMMNVSSESEHDYVQSVFGDVAVDLNAPHRIAGAADGERRGRGQPEAG